MNLSHNELNDFFNPVLVIAKHFKGSSSIVYHNVEYSNDDCALRIGVNAGDVSLDFRYKKEWDCIGIEIGQIEEDPFTQNNMTITKRISFVDNNDIQRYRYRSYCNFTDSTDVQFKFNGFDEANREEKVFLDMNYTEEDYFQQSLLSVLPSEDFISVYQCIHQKTLDELGTYYKIRCSFSELEIDDNYYEEILKKLWAFVQVLR